MTLTPDRGRKCPYGLNILIGLDQFVGTLWGIDSDETISSWTGKHRPGSWLETLINWLFYRLTGEQNHCERNRE